LRRRAAGLAQVVSGLREAGITVRGSIGSAEYGHVARAILDAADSCDAWMIVLGSSSRTDLPIMPFGSVSNRLLHMAKRPVLITPKTSVTAPATEPEASASAAG
jgi:nucleotide-binding universal stress UspA family protein